MRQLVILLSAVVLAGCSKSYSELVSNYASTGPASGTKIAADTFTITSRTSDGATTFRDFAVIRLSEYTIELSPGVPFMSSLSIPKGDIEYCAMTCFGTQDPRVDLIIPKVGANISIKNRNEMLDWCWKNEKPIMAGEDKRNWLYKNAPLPPKTSYSEQFKSHDKFELQATKSCLGY